MVLSWKQARKSFAILSLQASSACAPPVLYKHVLCVPFLHRAAGSRSQAISKGPLSKMLAQGSNLRLRDQGGSRGRSRSQDQKNQDSQHMLEQPRGYFPDIRRSEEHRDKGLQALISQKSRCKEYYWSCMLMCTPGLQIGLSCYKIYHSIRTRLTTTRDRSLQFRGAVSTGFFFEFSLVDLFPSSPGLLCSLVRKSPQNVEKIARSPFREKCVESCHVSGCHGLFGPD